MQSHQLNLDAYAARVGFKEKLEPTFAVLDELALRHVCSIPFENLDILLGKPIKLDLASLEEQLVTNKRGGYCFQQNGLMLGVLSQIGFDVTPLSGRVRLGVERDFLPPRTHLFLSVKLDGEEWIFDSGVGSASLTSIIRLHSRAEQPTRHETRRIVEEDGRFFHQIRSGDHWMDVYEFTGEEMPEIDRQVANWWTSTSKDAKFAKSLMASRALPTGDRIGILNDQLTIRRGGEVMSSSTIQSAQQLLEILRVQFDLSFPPETRFGTVEMPFPTS